MTRSICEAFGLAVRRQRQLLQWSQERLALEAGLNRSFLGEVERGEVAPSLTTIVLLARALGVRPALLLAESEKLTHKDGRMAPLAG